MKKLLVRFVLVLVAVALPLSTYCSTSTVGAAAGSDWRAGRIIDDGIFTNATAMTVGEIQAFLNAQVPVCDTWGTKPSEYGGGTRAQYAASRGYSTPFTCLKDYYEVPKTTPGPAEPANNYGGAAIPPGAQSAAQIIANAANKYNISPKALLVKLATESPGPLTSDDWPFERQYLYAMGAHCPDSGPGGAANCDVNYSGFSLQMDEAADLLRWYLDSMTQPWWQYKKPYQVNSILWNVVERGCGAGDVYIETKATAALYTYTPYQPNQAALNNMYGTGDNCSAYGNRNFWRVWYDWFGSTHSPNYSWSYAGQSMYTDSTKSTEVNPYGMSLKPGGRYYFVLKAKNTGNLVWEKGNFRLGTTNTLNRSSDLYDTSWISPGRPATISEATVQPGQVGTFEFWVNIPTNRVDTREYFNPLQEGVAWLNDLGMNIPIRTGGNYSWSYAGQSMYTDNTKTSEVNPYASSLNPGGRYYFVLRAKNTSDVTWYKGNFKLGVSRNGEANAIYDSTWISPGRAATINEELVQPGQVGTFEFWVNIPSTSVRFNAYFNPVQENIAWLNDIGMNIPIRTGGNYSWSYVGQTAYSDDTKSEIVDTYSSSLQPGKRYYLVLKAKNTGDVMWYRGNLRLGTSRNIERTSLFYDPTWVSPTRAATLSESSVAPGSVGTFEFWITTPTTQVSTKEYFNILQENIVWLNDLGMHYILRNY
jgi:hypothetical protein